ncbi:hypothetical protein GCM10023093_10590 [Nemorincola caseinilytica]|uniref:Lipocalin-like domain-containing protein n=1 Tax=Nemorincola caseinilytica TaxID=2054315 RepID=A0ABP8N862_9BACT
MMRRLVTLLVGILLLVPAVAFCIDNKDKKKQKLIIPGRWRETVRMLPDSTRQTFTDTLFIHFMPRDSFSYRNRKGFVYEGVYKLSEDSLLDMGTVRYKVLARTTDRLVLINASGIFHLVPDLSDTLKNIVLRKQDSARPVNHIDVMIGRWSVYKRETEGPGTIDPAENIRSAYITGPSTDGKQGFLYSGSDPDSKPSWYITELGGGQSLNCSGKSTRTLKVLRCQDGEMILEENKIKYYFRLYR